MLIAESLECHSGYLFPRPISVLLGNLMVLNPFMAATVASYHDFHHSGNVCNYSIFFTIWDTVLNSNAEYFEKYHLQEKTKEE